MAERPTEWPCPECGALCRNNLGDASVTDPMLAGVFRCDWMRDHRSCDRVVFHVRWQDKERTELTIDQVYKKQIDCCTSGADPHHPV